jgi:putative (di)nucleoside polyphosphate hydrolase
VRGFACFLVHCFCSAVRPVCGNIPAMNDYPYRKGVNAVVVDKDNKFLIVQKNAYEDNQWDFPGGGLDEGEDPETGILRELQEELGSGSFEIIKQSPINIKYEWPQETIERGYKKHGKWWRGQEKFQFIVRFTGNVVDMLIQEEELRRTKWVKYSDLKEHLVFEGQWKNAKSVIEEVGLDFD